MTSTNNLDLQGNFIAFPLAELLVEITQARLDGSLRLSHDAQKVIIYLSDGEIVFAVSNVRSSRIFDILLRENRIDKKMLSEIPSFTSDLELAKQLVKKSLFSKADIDALFVAQIENILKDTLEWKSGAWIFSPLTRIKENINFKINLHKLLIEYARNLSNENVYHRFRSLQEIFTAKPLTTAKLNLQPHEAFVLSRFSNSKLSVKEIKMFSGLPEAKTFQILYSLWLGGFLLRENWNAAFNEAKISAILSAKVQLKKESVPTETVINQEISAPNDEIAAETSTEIKEIVVEAEISLEDYLARVEGSITNYEVLDVAVKASSNEVKMAYFGLAKRFHPDHFHKETDTSLHNRIQTAFSRIAQAYEILKIQETRESYDFKMRKELAERKKMQNATDAEINQQQQTDLAGENFDQGFSLLMDENYAEAYPFLARAAFLAPEIARYHAYFGKVLSGDSSQRHKAEGELQTAIKLEPDNPTFRVMLVEFFIEYKLLKRAEGELNRMLAIFPDNREAKNLLDSLKNK